MHRFAALFLKLEVGKFLRTGSLFPFTENIQVSSSTLGGAARIRRQSSTLNNGRTHNGTADSVAMAQRRIAPPVALRPTFLEILAPVSYGPSLS